MANNMGGANAQAFYNQTPQGWVCPECQTINEQENKFCKNCGHKR